MDDRSSSGDNIEEELNDLKSEENMDIKSEWDDYGNQNNQLLEQIDIITHNMHNNIDEYNDEAKENAYDTIRELVNIIEENNRKRDILLEKLLNNNALIINRTVEKNNIKLHTTLNDQHNEILNICEEFNRQLIEKEEQIQVLEANIQTIMQIVDIKLNQLIEANNTWSFNNIMGSIWNGLRKLLHLLSPDLVLKITTIMIILTICWYGGPVIYRVFNNNNTTTTLYTTSPQITLSEQQQINVIAPNETQLTGGYRNFYRNMSIILKLLIADIKSSIGYWWKDSNSNNNERKPYK